MAVFGCNKNVNIIPYLQVVYNGIGDSCHRTICNHDIKKIVFTKSAQNKFLKLFPATTHENVHATFSEK